MDYIFGKIRLQIINNNIVRLEYAKKEFFNDDTFFIPSRQSLFESTTSDVLETDDKCIVSLGELNISVEKDAKSLNGITVTNKEGTVIYIHHNSHNKGELPKLNKTPVVFPVFDNPRITMPKDGYKVSEEEYHIDNNAQDVYLLICNKDFKLLRKLYVELTGRSELVRLSTLGYWNSKYFVYSQETAKQNILDHENHNVPLDNMVIDTDWRKASDRGIGYDIDEKLFPDMKAYLRYAHRHNVEIMFNDHPEPVEGASSCLDKKEIAYRNEKLTDLLNIGLDIWWYDRNWHTKLVSPTKYILPETFGLYLFEDVTKQHYKQKARSNKRYIRPVIMGNVNNIINGKYAKIYDSASHRYSIQWTGDICCDDRFLKNELCNLIKAGNNMISYINPDCGGHIGDPDKELFIHWMQFGAFAPVFRPHCTCDVVRSREPWVYDEETLNITHDYINMRYHLLPVIYKNAFNNYMNGEPIFKSLAYEYPNDKRAYRINNQYMLGNNILVAPKYDNVSSVVEKSHFVKPVHCTYFNGRDWEGEPILEKDYSQINFYWYHEHPEVKVPIYDFSARYETELLFDEDVILLIESDDGAIVYIDGEMVLEDRKMHAAKSTKLGMLTKGVNHTLRIDYFQAGGEACISLYYHSFKKTHQKSVYLPEGNWIDPFNGRIKKGGKKTIRNYELNELPLFVRQGAVLPLAKTCKNTKKQMWNELIYDFYPSKTQFDKGYLYEDDTKTVAYKYGEYKISEFETSYDEKQNHIVLDLKASKGHFKGNKEFSSRDVIIKYHLIKGVDKVKEVLINGEKVPFVIDAKHKEAMPFIDEGFAADSKVLLVKVKLDLLKDYSVHFVLQ